MLKLTNGTVLKGFLASTILISTPHVITINQADATTITLQDVRAKLLQLSPTPAVELDLDTGQVNPKYTLGEVSIASVKEDTEDSPEWGIGYIEKLTPEEIAAREEAARKWREAKAEEEKKAQIYTQNADGTWSVKGDKAATTKASSSNSKYQDFSSKAYWADDMLWLVNNGYLTGYVNKKHPTTGKHGTWLDPNGQLTEAQMLSVLLRYNLGLKGYEQMKKDIPNPGNNWSYNHYVTAEKIGMMTKGSSKNGSYAGKQVTRGQLAQALVSMHYGQDVTLNEAVKFMFDNNISSGVNPSKGATVENFAPNTKLSRAHISAFLKRFHDAKASGNLKDIPRLGGSDTVTKPPVTPKPDDSASNNNGKDVNIYTLVPKKDKTADVVGNKIKTKFGERSYGAKTQAQYDETMAILEKEYKTGRLDFEGIGDAEGVELQAFQDYFFKGKTAIKDKRDPNYRTPYNQKLVAVEKSFGAFKGYVKTMDDINMILSLTEIQGQAVRPHISHTVDPNLINPSSAYELVVHGLWDCTSEAYYINAMFDQLGIESFVLESPGRVHAFVGLKLYGEWFIYDTQSTSGYLKMTADFLVGGDRIDYAPNGGISSLPTAYQKIYTPKN